MAIEMLEDIIEDLANQIGIYGACSEHSDECECRVCFGVEMRSRILAAVKVEEKLAKHE